MDDLKNDFYKIYTHDGGTADTVFCPCCVPLFGEAMSCENSGLLPVLGLRLSFGARAAFRKRADGRIVLSHTGSDTRAQINKSNIEKLITPIWARDMVRSMSKLPIKLSGIEMLIHADVDTPELAPQQLCAVFATATAFSGGFSPAVILRAAGSQAHFIPAVSESEQRAAVINTATLNYIPLDFNLKANKIIIARIFTRRIKPHFTHAYQERELERLNAAVAAIKNSDIGTLSPLMLDASRDMLTMHKKSNILLLFLLCRDFTSAVKITPDYRGIIAIVPDDKVDAFTREITLEYEKKAGSRPAFYISD